MNLRPATEAKLVRSLLDNVDRAVDRICRARGRDHISLMEVCGTHTMAISSSGIRRAVDRRLRLLSGPGCPVCVTAQGDIDAAVALAARGEVTVVTFGDMVRVPGSEDSLEQAKARGADVRVVYSALDALRLAVAEPDRQFVFLGVGFETTAPTVAAAVAEARRGGVANFSVLAMFKLVPPALQLIAASERTEVDGFILPGHVSAVIGTRPYEFLPREHGLPCCVAGFEASDVLQGVLMLLAQMAGEPGVEIQYRRVVRRDGNPRARATMDEVLEPVAARWRGIGPIERSGLGFRDGFREFDAARRFGVEAGESPASDCRCGEVMLGLIVPPECGLFGRRCTPRNPAGPCMVSSEGACAAYYKYDMAENR